MHLALEELQADDGIDDDHEEDEQGNVEQGEHGLEDGVEDHLQACHGRVGRREMSPSSRGILALPLYLLGSLQDSK